MRTEARDGHVRRVWGRVLRRAYQPVVVRRPLARDGRGFRGL
jgi:hypothetical protein